MSESTTTFWGFIVTVFTLFLGERVAVFLSVRIPDCITRLPSSGSKEVDQRIRIRFYGVMVDVWSVFFPT